MGLIVLRGGRGNQAGVPFDFAQGKLSAARPDAHKPRQEKASGRFAQDDTFGSKKKRILHPAKDAGKDWRGELPGWSLALR